ncbi:hypothetical protein Ocin01_17518 [Orchesella cincta]|uniref:Uncharacterized protein n=1 Tax=Orchesella cincta TaxID=48709 RepID=A0A1D2M850_ORCCI|nr:hypothetical protein Ocin01_17518 [Orchesella cincta]
MWLAVQRSTVGKILSNVTLPFQGFMKFRSFFSLAFTATMPWHGVPFCLTMSYPTQPGYPAQPSPFQQPAVYSPAVPQTGGFGPTQYAAAPAAPGFTPNRAANPTGTISSLQLWLEAAVA